MKIVIEGSPEEIERILRKLAPRERQTRLQPAPYHLQPIVGPQIPEPVQPMITYPGFPWGTVTSGGLTLGDGVAPLTVGYVTQH